MKKQESTAASEITKYNANKNRVSDLLENYRGEITKALPRHLTAEILMRAAFTAAIKNPSLMECTEHSFLGAVLTISQLGLIPDSVIGECYMIPFKNTKKNCKEVQVIIGYRGLITLARRTGLVKRISAVPVFADGKEDSDFFEYELGFDEKLKHVPAGITDPERITHFYAIIEFLNGGRNFVVMTRSQVEAVRNESSNYKFAEFKNNTIWFNHFAEMGVKTALRKLLKLVPMSAETNRAITLDELAENGVSQGTAAEFLDDLKEDKYKDAVVTDIINDEADLADKILNQQRQYAEQKGKVATDATENLIVKKRKKVIKP